MTGWEDEYARRGIPSSYRDEPSGAVRWAFENWPRLDGVSSITGRGLDVGCGTARNTVYAASQGMSMIGFDRSEAAIERGRDRVRASGLDATLLVHDLDDGLPAADGEIDLVLDIFVYKHQVRAEGRRAYRDELLRVLAPGGRVVMSLAEPTDGYYGSCPAVEDPLAGPHAVVDPELDVGSVLFTLEELTVEFSDGLLLEMAWRRRRIGDMHGNPYVRHTLSTLWRRATRSE